MSEERIIVTALGRNKVGIVAGISTVLAEHNASIIELTSAEMSGHFVMVMLVDISKIDVSLTGLQENLNNKGKEIGVQLTAQHEVIFRYMHRI